MSILIKNGKVWSGEGFSFSDVFIRNKIIERVEPKINSDADFVYDATGEIVSAGLIDIHTHMSGISCKSFGTSPDLSCVPFGVCYAMDCSTIMGNKENSDSFVLKTKVFSSTDIKNNHISTDIAFKMMKEYEDKLIGIKVYFDDSQCDAKDITPLLEARDFASANNLKIMVHCTGSPVKMSEIVKVLRKGDIITHPYHGGKNSSSDNNFKALKMAKEKGIIIDSGLAGHVHTDFSVLREALNLGLTPDTISTDITCKSAYVRGGKYGMTMCMSIFKDLGMSEENIFRSVTSNAAKAVGIENEAGYLLPGRIADVSVFKYDDEKYDLTDNWSHQRVYSDKSYKCAMTICDGAVVYRG